MQYTSRSACGAWPPSFAASLSRRRSLSLGASIALCSHSVDSQISRVTCCSYRSRRRGYGGLLNLRSASSVAATDELGFHRFTKRFCGAGRKMFQMAPVHHHFELSGFKEPSIVATAYVVSGIFALLAGYVGLISA